MKHVKPVKIGIDLNPPPILTVRELSKYLHVHPTTVYRLLRSKKIPGFRVGGEWRFGVDLIERWRSEAEQTAAASVRRHTRSQRASTQTRRGLLL